MCIQPLLLENGALVGCRKCWQCKSNRVDNWVGRNIAESHTSTVSYAVTFTYGRDIDGKADHISSVHLMYSDMQKLFKRMRKRRYSMRYIVAGEYGEALGRAHWHGVFHFYGDVLPEWEGAHLRWTQDEWDNVGGIHIPEWTSRRHGPIGFVHIKKATYSHTRYALKYLLKNEIDPNQQALFHMSKKPPLGYTYFMERARDVARTSLPLEDLYYHFPIRTMSGLEQNKSFMLNGTLAKLYVAEYIRQWPIHNTAPLPETELVYLFSEYGRWGDEDRLVQSRVSQHPPATSIFNSFGEVKSEAPRKLTWAEYCVRQDERVRQKWLERKARKERRADGTEKKKRDANAAAASERDGWARRRLQLTEQEWNVLSAAHKRFAYTYPAAYRELWEFLKGARRAPDNGGDRSGGAERGRARERRSR